MILVILGTQDKDFSRLLKAVDKEIEKGTITDRVVVQAGQTKYKSDNMEIFDLVEAPKFEKLIDEADLIITHGGVGSILSGIKKNKKIIAAARLSKYKEHHNDHQKQIIEEFVKEGYILELTNFNELGLLIEKIKDFKPKRFVSNTKNMVKLIENYIEDSNNISFYNRYREVIAYLFFGMLTTLINIFAFYILRKLNIGIYISNVIAWIVSVLFAFVTNKLFVFESKNNNMIKEMIEFYFFRILSLVFDMGLMFLLIEIININDMISKIITNIFVIIINYLFSKLFVFKK